MSNWTLRPQEEKSLLNPGFCAAVLWNSAKGFHTETTAMGGAKGMPFELAYLILPLVLHRVSRDSLPARLNSSLAVWLDEYPLVRARLAERASLLVPFTREALLFGGIHGALGFSGTAIVHSGEWKAKFNTAANEGSEEVRACFKRAEFLGRWFARSGSASTIMALLGVRP